MDEGENSCQIPFNLRRCIDEFVFRKGHDDRVAAMGEVYFIEAGKKEEAIRSVLACVSSSVQWVVSDLKKPFKGYIQKRYV
jgi:Transposase